MDAERRTPLDLAAWIESRRQHYMRTVAIIVFLWVGFGVAHLPLKWLWVYLITLYLVVTATYWYREYRKAQAMYICPHGYTDTDLCPDCCH